jgi:hypothetical protein
MIIKLVLISNQPTHNGYLKQQGPKWQLNRSLKNALKGGAVDGTPLEALIMRNYCARSYLKNAKKNQNSKTSGNKFLNGHKTEAKKMP